jgi:hypothetical protein
MTRKVCSACAAYDPTIVVLIVDNFTAFVNWAMGAQASCASDVIEDSTYAPLSLGVIPVRGHAECNDLALQYVMGCRHDGSDP